jgi:hypothetical protein
MISGSIPKYSNGNAKVDGVKSFTGVTSSGAFPMLVNTTGIDYDLIILLNSIIGN